MGPKDFPNLRLTGRLAASHDSTTLHWARDNRDLARVRYDRYDETLQIFADVLGRTIEQVREPVLAGVRGAAILAAVGIGATTFDAVPDQVAIAGAYRPNPLHREVYAELFREFVRLYRNNRGSHARLNRPRRPPG